MDHKNLLDDVIKNMTSTNTTEETKEIDGANDVMDNAGNSIQLAMSTGEIFLIDPDKFDWDRAVTQITQLEANIDAFRNMMYGIMMAAGHDDEDHVDFIANIKEKLEQYFEGYQIKVDYRMHNPELTEHQIVMLMLFDASNITKTMYHHISLYSALSLFGGHGNNDNLSKLADMLVGNDSDASYSAYRVVASGDEGGINITSIEETDDYKPDSIGVVEETGIGEYTVIVYGRSEEEAKQMAEVILNLPHSFINEGEIVEEGGGDNEG